MNSNLPYGPVNVELFQRVKAIILEEPRRFDMQEWGHYFSPERLCEAFPHEEDRPPLDVVYHFAWGQALGIDVLQPWPMSPQKPTCVQVSFDRDVWVLRYKSLNHKTGELRQRERTLYGHNNVQEAVTDAVEYFGGLVSRDEILYQEN